MRKLFPGKSHTSILTQLLSLATVFIISFAILSPSVYAACSPKSGTGCTTSGQTFSCSYTASGTTSQWCCGNATECNAQKSTGATSVTQGKGVLKVNPEGSCNGGIDTALGCIPYDTKGFTAALLGFLAGIVGVIALIVMIVATIMIMTGGANPEQVKKGKELFTGGITGLFFIIFSVTILRIIAGDIIKLPGF